VRQPMMVERKGALGKHAASAPARRRGAQIGALACS
jgi:hypothetical protein